MEIILRLRFSQRQCASQNFTEVPVYFCAESPEGKGMPHIFHNCKPQGQSVGKTGEIEDELLQMIRIS